MNKFMNRRVIIPLVLIILATAALTVLLAGRDVLGKKQNSLKMGFVMTGRISEGGWNGMLYGGASSACEEAGVTLLVKENVEEFSGQCIKAVQDLISEGTEVIILTSYNYAEEVKEVMEQHPEVFFYTESGTTLKADNLSIFFPRMYQARFLAGLVAGATTKTGVAGYVAAMNNSEVNRGINAFTLGVLTANPEAKVVVGWTGSWDDAAAEKEMARKLVEMDGADVLTYHQNQPNTVMAADELGVYSVAYHVSGTELSENCLTGVVCDWKKLFQEVLKDYTTGKAEGQKILWPGLEAGVVMLSDYGKAVSQETKDLVMHETQNIYNGRDIFSGEIYDNQGEKRSEEGESIPDKTLMQEMDWFVRGVTFHEE